MIDYTLLTLAIALLAVTVLGKVRLHDWWIRACEFPRVQIVSLAVLVAFAALWLENDGLQKWVLAILVVVLALQLYRILPWTRLWPLQVQSAESGQEDRCVTLMIANVLTPNRNSEGLIRQVQEHRPDVLLTLESDQWWGDQLDAAFGDWPTIIRVPLDNLSDIDVESDLTGNARDYVRANRNSAFDGMLAVTWNNLSVPYFFANDNIYKIRTEGGVTIEAGTKLIFGANAGLQVDEGSSLTAVGTADAKIEFVGEDDAAQSWRGLMFYSNDTSNRLEHVVVKSGGSDSFNSNGDEGGVRLADGEGQRGRSVAIDPASASPSSSPSSSSCCCRCNR